MRSLIPATLLAVLALPAPAAAADSVRLDVLGRDGPGAPETAEIAAVHPGTERVFATNARDNRLDVYDLSTGAPRLLAGESVALDRFGAGPNSVAVSRRCDLVAVAVESDPATDPGRLVFVTPRGRFRFAVQVGALPDMVAFTPDGRTALVANEGEPSGYGAGATDPEGSVSVVSLRRDCTGARVRTARFAGVPLQGPVRIFGPGASVAQDLEPEYIAAGRRRAWVTLQENNAVGLLDVRTARFAAVRALGFKDHGTRASALDPSDEDGGAAVRPAPGVFGMYQPDAIAAFTLRGRPLLVTANEGDAREYDGFAEEAAVADLALDPTAFPGDVRAEDELGRLTVTTTLGDTDGDGDHDALYAFGGRSMSVLSGAGAVLHDTGAAFERRVARLDPATFNLDNEADSDVDDRSPDKGPEPEGIATGLVGGRPYAFVGAERQGGVFALDLSRAPHRTPIAGYATTRPDDLGPEGLAFVAGRDSPTGRPLVLMTNEVSGTLVSLEVRRVR